jgi:predicted nucleotidyltransferase
MLKDRDTSEDSQNKPPTSYPEVNAFLDQFLSQTHAVLKQNFIGMYLYGSLALGDFDPESSDIDILVVTASKLPTETVEALEALHERVQKSQSPWATRLEVSYQPVAALRRYDPTNNRYPHISTVSPFSILEHGRDWIINRHIVREKGVVIAGPSPKTLIDPISSDDLKATVRILLCNSWIKHVSGSDWMRPRKYQAFTTLTMCRSLYVLKYGTTISKPEAAAWALETLEVQWRPLIKQALSWRYDPQPDDMTETLRFLRYTIEQSKQG